MSYNRTFPVWRSARKEERHPLGLVTALLLFGVSLIGLIVRLGQRRSVKGWGIVAVTSLLLAFVFGSISNSLYNGELPENADPTTVSLEEI